MNLDLEVICMEDIGWNRGRIEKISLIKAQAILSFCNAHNIEYPI